MVSVGNVIVLVHPSSPAWSWTALLMLETQWLYAATVVYTPAAFATKVVLILMIARVFAVRQRVSWALKALCVLIALTYIPLQAFKVCAHWNS